MAMTSLSGGRSIFCVERRIATDKLVGGSMPTPSFVEHRVATVVSSPDQIPFSLGIALLQQFAFPCFR